MVPIKDDATHNGGEKLPQQYDQSMGVRLGDTCAAGRQLNQALDEGEARHRRGA